MLELQEFRRFFAEELRWAADLNSERLIDAFATIPRERFLGPGPWKVMSRGMRYRDTPDDDPRHIYHNTLVALIPERGLNNGEPAFLATLIAAAEIRAGESVVHLGCGVGYYSAIMAELAGPTGHVTAIDVDESLAQRAKANLADRSNVTAVHADAIDYDAGPADVILVNAGVTHPQRRWLERLRENGRMIIPTTFTLRPAEASFGLVLCVTQTGGDYAVRIVSQTAIIAAVGGRDPDLNAMLSKRFEALRAPPPIASLRVLPHAEEESCWLHSELMCLSTKPV
jgi:protein-L-isoaspartate(D-aspartate) O-methyltransferase